MVSPTNNIIASTPVSSAALPSDSQPEKKSSAMRHAPSSSSPAGTTPGITKLAMSMLAVSGTLIGASGMTVGHAGTVGRRDDGGMIDHNSVSLLYGGKKMENMSIYKPNANQLTDGKATAQVLKNANLTHENYLQNDNLRGVGQDIMAHRGYMDPANGIPENSMAAIRKAYDLGIRSQELDVRVTADGVPIVLHDLTLGRMLGDEQNKLVSHTNWADIKDKFLVSRTPVNGDFVETGEKVPTVEHALALIKKDMPGTSIVLDCKDRTGEAVFDLLLARPDLREFVAIKPYAKEYLGGFDHLLSNLYERHQVDLHAPHHAEKRAHILDALRTMMLVPVFSQSVLEDPEFLKMHAPQKASGHSAEELATAGMAWLHSFQGAMDIKIIEAHSMGLDTPAGSAMDIINSMLADSAEALSNAAMSGGYRYEDFSVAQPNGEKKFYVWGDSGEIYDKTDDKVAAERETAGSLRHEGQSMLTDQPGAEAMAILKDKTLARGHTGLELDVPPGQVIDVTRNRLLANHRKAQYKLDQTPPNFKRIMAMRDERLGGAKPSGQNNGSWHSVLAGAAGVGVLVAVASAARKGGLTRAVHHMNRGAQRGAGFLAAAVRNLRNDGSDPAIPLVNSSFGNV